MSQRIKPRVKKRRLTTILWISGLFLLVSLLIYFEQTALLYIVSTLGVTVLLVIVAIADLGEGDHGPTANDPAQPLSSRSPAR